MSTQSILAFDCACIGGSVTLRANGNSTSRLVGQTKEAAELIPAINGLLKGAGVAYASLGAIITTVGPGSFTGVRIGLAALHGLVLAHQTPIKAVTTLEAMAWAVALMDSPPAQFYIAIRAGKGELYTQKFTLHPLPVIPAEAGIHLSTEQADSSFRWNDELKVVADCDIALLPETHIAWDAPCFGNHLPATDAHHLHGPDATALVRVADRLPTATLAEALPVYIRPPDAVVGAPMPWLVQN
ncbi:MAG: tRNA (adenosine(37)-N6)-threonylcarbamoyltransferase complex dimerization subunit type 1 TsaB [Rickettsiales bacterium]